MKSCNRIHMLCWHKLWCSHHGWGKSFISSLLHCSFRRPSALQKAFGEQFCYETLPESLTLRIARNEDNVHLVRFQPVFNAPIARCEFEKPPEADISSSLRNALSSLEVFRDFIRVFAVWNGAHLNGFHPKWRYPKECTRTKARFR